MTETIYLSLISKLYKIDIYNNISEKNFITSDDPCFNQKFEEGCFFVQIPISPKKMIQLSKNDKIKEISPMIEYYNYHKINAELIKVNSILIDFHDMDENNVLVVNKKILENKDRYIYFKSHNDIANLAP